MTNICHYFNLLDEICAKIHAVTSRYVLYITSYVYVFIRISPTLSVFAPYRV